jgi:hypothetical protein
MSNAEITIRQDIENMTILRCATVRKDIERDIKYAFWHEFININTYNELMEKVREKYNEVCS